MKTRKQVFRNHKLALTMSVLLGSMGTYMLSSSPLSAESAPISTTPIAVAGTLPKLTTMIKNNRSAVVSISVTGKQSKHGKRFEQLSKNQLPKEFRELFKDHPKMPWNNKSRKSRSHGSGFIVSADGYIVTNAHVVENAAKIKVSLDDKRKFGAKVIGVDKLSDIALLKIETSNLHYVAMGDSDKLEVGEWVVAIGTPFGLDYTATQGIVSALSRSLPTETYVPFIQTDAAVNPGNSGGPLFNLAGQVIGVNSQIYSRSGGYMGVSFAIPINIVKNVTEQLKSSGKVSRGWLGVSIQNVNQSLAKSFGMKDTNGSLISSVSKDSPASKAGLQVGDVIISYDEKLVDSASHLPILVGSTPIGKELAITVLRSGNEKTLKVTINKLGGNDDPVIAASEKGSLGVIVSVLSKEEKSTLANKDQGVKVNKVLADGSAENAGIRSGDIILTVDGESVSSPATLKSIIQKAEGDKPLAILLQRGDQALFVAVHLDL